MKSKVSNEKKIVAALDSIDKVVDMFQKLGEEYVEKSDKALMRGDDKRAKRLLMQKIILGKWALRFETLKDDITLRAVQSKAISGLGKLPDAIDGCRKLQKELPDLKKLSKSIKKVFVGLDDEDGPLSEFFKAMEKDLAPIDEDVFRESTLDEMEMSEQDKDMLAALKKEMELQDLRVKASISGVGAAAPVATDDPIGATGDADLASIIAAENNKKK